MAEILFHGAVEEVTGSLHLVQVDGRWVALDCGLCHGRRSEVEEKNRAWPIPPAELSAVVLSHAHIDHSGRLPRLVRDGYDGPIFCTPATRDLCAIMLADSAHIQEEDVFYINKRRKRKGLDPVEPLYEHADAVGAVRLMQTVSYGRWFPVVPGLLAKFQDAGHMLGSAGVHLEFAKRNGHTPSLFFTGDLGRPNKAILRDPEPLPPCTTVLCESTYGDRDNESAAQAKQALIRIASETFDRGGKLIIPAFSVGRTQTVAYYLQEAMLEGSIPEHPIYIDSPLACDATDVFMMHPECFDADAQDLRRLTGDLWGPSCCIFTRSVEESKRLHGLPGPYTILSASGMCEAGRIRHHLKNNIGDAKNTILIAGYQAAYTLGRRIADGEKQINLFHEQYQVRARIEVIHGFSAHADRDDLVRMLSPLKGKTQDIYLVHGEQGQRQALADRLGELGFTGVHLPGIGDKAVL